MRQQYEQAERKRQAIELQRELVMLREVLTKQVVGLYSRRPFATDELRSLASEVLQDPAAVDRLMPRVTDSVAKVPPPRPPTPIPPGELKSVKSDTEGTGLLLWLAIGGGVLIAGLYLIPKALRKASGNKQGLSS